MHFLCLHGIGTNSYVLETQIAAIRYEMDQHHTFDFAEGCEPTSIAPEIDGFYPSNDAYFSYFHHSVPSLSKSLEQLHNYIQVEGPFDGVIAFSQGAALISTYLIQLARAQPHSTLPFRCAIFFSGTAPIDAKALAYDEYKLLDLPAQTGVLQLPTAHIWGEADVMYKDHAAKLCEACAENQRDIFIHQGGHEIPGPRAKHDIEKCVRLIRRIIEKASIDR